jgi:sugar phosphate isomerase/epimerase
MKIGLVTEGLQELPLTDALDWIAAQGIEEVEISTGNFTPATHCDLHKLLVGADARQEFSDTIASRGLALSALKCNGNPIDPHPRRREESQDVLLKTVELACELDVATVVSLSGCAGDPTGGTYPNWVTHPWQPEFIELYKWQWDEAVTPFWRSAGQYAADHGVRIAIELHPGQAVYNALTLRRLREIAGSNVGANLDPGHLFYLGMDPLLLIRTLGEGFIFHVHAKDARINPFEMAINGGLDMRPMAAVTERSWGYRTVGYGHGELWWREFVSDLRAVGYDGVLSVEHEDSMMSVREGIIKSVEFLRPIVLLTTADS